MRTKNSHAPIRSITPTPDDTRRWFQFSLRTMFLLVTVAGVGLYVAWRIRQAAVARTSFQDARVKYEWDTISAEDMCEASTRLYRAEIAIPFADREKAATDQFRRIEKIWNHAYGPSSEWLMGIANDEDWKKAEARRAAVESCYLDAARIAGVELSPAPD